MTEPELLAWFRGLERLLIVFGAITSGVCGMLLFKWGVGGSAKLVVEHDKTKAQLINATPGAIAMLFGAAILGLAISNKACFTGLSDQSSKSGASQSNVTPTISFEYGGAEESRTNDFLIRFRDSDAEKINKDLVIEWQKQVREILQAQGRQKAR